MINTLMPIILTIEITLIIIFLMFSFRNKTVISKSTAWYIIPVYIVNILIYSIGIYNINKTFTLIDFSQAFVASTKMFGFEITSKLFLIEDLSNPLFASCLYIAAFMSAFTLISSILAFFKMSIVNTIRVIYRKSRNPDILIGINENSIAYAKNNKNSIIWIDSLEIKLNKDDKNKLYSNKIPFIYRPLTTKKLSSFLSFKSTICHFIIFSSKDKLKYRKYIEIFTNQNFKTKATVFLHVEARNEYIDFVDAQMSEKVTKSNNNLIATCFNVHELVARNFSLKNTILDSIKKEDINNGIIKENINVFFIGFGKINYSMFRSCILNNQFIKIENNKFAAKPINYYLYDKTDDAFNKELIARLDLEYYKQVLNKELPPLEKICNLYHKKINIKTANFIDEIKSKIKPNDYNIFFISFSDGIENASFATFIEKYFKHQTSNLRIYYNIDHSFEVLNQEFIKNVQPYGFKDEILKHDIIADDKLADLARRINNRYHKTGKDKEYEIIKWEKRPVVEKYSNIYSAININFKLKMMKIDINAIEEKEYKSIYFQNRTQDEINNLIEFKDYGEYFNTSLRTAMAYQEHLRWCAFYYVNNFDQMSLNDIHIKNNNIIIKCIEEKEHCCLTSFYGLDSLHNYMVALSNGQKTLSDIETYKYDFMVCDNLYNSIDLVKEKLNS